MRIFITGIGGFLQQLKDALHLYYPAIVSRMAVDALIEHLIDSHGDCKGGDNLCFFLALRMNEIVSKGTLDYFIKRAKELGRTPIICLSFSIAKTNTNMMPKGCFGGPLVLSEEDKHQFLWLHDTWAKKGEISRLNVSVYGTLEWAIKLKHFVNLRKEIETACPEGGYLNCDDAARYVMEQS